MTLAVPSSMAESNIKDCGNVFAFLKFIESKQGAELNS